MNEKNKINQSHSKNENGEIKYNLRDDPRISGIFETIIPLREGAVQKLVKERLTLEERDYILAHRNVAEVLSMIAFNEGRSRAVELIFTEIQEMFPNSKDQPRLYEVMKTWGWLKNYRYSGSFSEVSGMEDLKE